MSLAKLFESLTHNWQDLIKGIAIKTGLKMENTNYTIFVFAKHSENVTNGKFLLDKTINYCNCGVRNSNV